MYSGIISLYSHADCLLKSEHYHTSGQRKKIIAHWKLLFESTIDKCFIQIYPIANPSMVWEDGKNKMVMTFKDNRVKEKIERPKAEYQNLPTYNYDK